MLTIVSSPKPFEGHFGVIQRNAIESWLRISPRPQIILFGEAAGTAEIAEELGLEHVPTVGTNELGTPLLRALLEAGEQRARHQLICYVNGDIILTAGFEAAVHHVSVLPPRFLMIGERINLDLDVPIDFDAGWRERLATICSERGTRGDHTSIDFFVFPRGFYRDVPPLTIGRAWFDQWMIKEAARRGLVVDASALRPIVHQNHGYAHVAGGRSTVYQGVEAERNLAIYGGRAHAYTLLDATHAVGADGKVRRTWFRKQRHRAGEILWDLMVRRTAPLRQALEARGLRRRSRAK